MKMLIALVLSMPLCLAAAEGEPLAGRGLHVPGERHHAVERAGLGPHPTAQVLGEQLVVERARLPRSGQACGPSSVIFVIE